MRPLKVVLYASLLGLLLASYLQPLQEMVQSRALIAGLRPELHELEGENASRKRLIEELETPEGIERAARERYGMVKPGEQVYIVTGGER